MVADSAVCEAGELKLADDAELRLLEGMRRTGRVVLQEWADGQLKKASQELYQSTKLCSADKKRRFVNCTVIFASRPTQIQLAAMEQNPCPVVGEVAKLAGVGLALISWIALLNPSA